MSSDKGFDVGIWQRIGYRTGLVAHPEVAEEHAALAWAR